MENQLLRAWGWLVALSAATTMLSLVSFDGPDRLVAGFLILALAGFKARIILAQYLGLERSLFWRRGFEAFLVVFLLAAFALYAFSWGTLNG